jgi:hypothetical protein
MPPRSPTITARPGETFILIENAYENERNSTPQVIRRQAYWADLSGACGHAMGNAPIYTMKPGWKEALQQPGSQSMAFLAHLLRTAPWSTLVPDQKHEWVISGYGMFGAAAGKDVNYRLGLDYVTAAASADSRWLIAYLPAKNRITVGLARFARPVRALWFDPAGGAWSAAARAVLPNRGQADFEPPGKNAGDEDDWVLVFRPAMSQQPQ